MKDEALAVGVKVALGGGAAAALGLTWWAIAAAVAGAAACALHFEAETTPSTLWRVLIKIVALTILASLLAVAAPHIPGFAWTENILLAIRAGLLGAFASPVYELGRRAVTFVSSRFGNTGG